MWQSLKKNSTACMVSQTTSYCLSVKPCRSMVLFIQTLPRRAYIVTRHNKPCGFLWNMFGPVTRVMTSLLQRIYWVGCMRKINLAATLLSTKLKVPDIGQDALWDMHKRSILQIQNSAKQGVKICSIYLDTHKSWPLLQQGDSKLCSAKQNYVTFLSAAVLKDWTTLYT